jgi:imidazolonepropionase-like amidohydrolase
MTKTIVVCGHLFDGLSDGLLGPTEILIEDDTISEISNSVSRPAGATIYDLSDRTVSPGFIDTHVHLCVDGLDLTRQTLQTTSARFWPACNICDSGSQRFAIWVLLILDGQQSNCAMQSTRGW